VSESSYCAWLLILYFPSCYTRLAEYWVSYWYQINSLHIKICGETPGNRYH